MPRRRRTEITRIALPADQLESKIGNAARAEVLREAEGRCLRLRRTHTSVSCSTSAFSRVGLKHKRSPKKERRPKPTPSLSAATITYCPLCRSSSSHPTSCGPFRSPRSSKARSRKGDGQANGHDDRKVLLHLASPLLVNGYLLVEGNVHAAN